MARNKAFDPAIVLDRAMGRFWANGFDGTSTQDLMSAMHLGKRSLYDTFGNKHELYLRALAEYVRRVELVHAEVLDAEGSVVDRIAALLGSGLRLPDVTPPGCFAVNAGTASAHAPEVRSLVDQHFDRSTLRIAAALRQAGTDRADDLAVIVHTAWVGLRARAAAGLSGADQRAVAVEIAALVG